ISKVNRLDLGLPSFQAAIAIEPANDDALEGLCEVYRRAQQWPELGAVLVRRADAAPTPARGRDFRAQAAEILETKLSDGANSKGRTASSTAPAVIASSTSTSRIRSKPLSPHDKKSVCTKEWPPFTKKSCSIMQSLPKLTKPFSKSTRRSTVLSFHSAAITM